MRAIHTLAAAAALFGASAAFALPSAIVFDGYCDGLSNIVANENSTVTATWSNNDCFGATAPAIGQRTRVSGSGLGVTGSYVADIVMGMLVRINDNGTWTYYDVNGSLVNWGTWSDATAVRVAPGTRPSTQR